MGTHGDDILSIETQFPCDINLEAYIAVVGTTDALAIEIHIAHIHNALKVEQQALALKGCVGGIALDIPAGAHLLEGTGRKAALEVGRSISIVGALLR